VGIEAGALSFVLAREIEREVKAKVYVLNPGKLHMIFRSVRKTDTEDAMKIARFIASNPEEALPVVSIPSEKEEACRALVSEMMFLTQSKTRLINRLHSTFVRSGITEIKKSVLKAIDCRRAAINTLHGHYLEEALRLALHIGNLEIDIQDLEIKEQELLSTFDKAKYVLSIPGVGLKTALAFFAHIGNGERFSSGSQVSNYVGMVPKLDISGDTIRYGRIHKRGNSTLRALLVQAAWALVRSKNGGELKMKYHELAARKGKKKAIVAVARKLLELCWTLVMKKELYRNTTEEAVLKKMRFYNIEYFDKVA
jgi:transposase